MLSDDDFRQLLYFLDRPWTGFRKVRKGVKKRVRRHMQALGCTSIHDYLHLIEHHWDARAECEHQLLVTISRFFRDRHLWKHLHERILPGLARRFPNGLTAWSAGCANGEEPYSLSMVWEDMAENNTSLPAMHILATDADATCLQRAREGLYPESSRKELPEDFRRRWFQKTRKGGLWQIDDRLRTRIQWQAYQLLAGPPHGDFHLILLRNNLLTYYQGPEMKTAFERIAAAVADGGILVIGSHERPPSFHLRLNRDAICPWVYHATDGMRPS